MHFCILCSDKFVDLKEHVLDVHKETIALNAVALSDPKLCGWLEDVLGQSNDNDDNNTIPLPTLTKMPEMVSRPDHDEFSHFVNDTGTEETGVSTSASSSCSSSWESEKLASIPAPLPFCDYLPVIKADEDESATSQEDQQNGTTVLDPDDLFLKHLLVQSSTSPVRIEERPRKPKSKRSRNSNYNRDAPPKTCSMCKEQVRIVMLSRHAQRHFPLPLFSCSECSYTGLRSDPVKQHIKKCGVNAKCLRLEDNFNALAVEREKLFPYCGTKMTNIYQPAMKTPRTRKGMIRATTCTMCKSVVTSGKLDHHVITHHFTLPLYKCYACGLKSKYHPKPKVHQKCAKEGRLMTGRIPKNYEMMKLMQKRCFPHNSCFSNERVNVNQQGQSNDDYEEFRQQDDNCELCSEQNVKRKLNHVLTNHFSLPLYSCTHCGYEAKFRRSFYHHKRCSDGDKAQFAQIQENFAMMHEKVEECFPSYRRCNLPTTVDRTFSVKVQSTKEAPRRRTKSTTKEVLSVATPPPTPPTTVRHHHHKKARPNLGPSFCTLCGLLVETKRQREHVTARHFSLPLWQCAGCGDASKSRPKARAHIKCSNTGKLELKPVEHNFVQLKLVKEQCFPGPDAESDSEEMSATAADF